MYKNVSRFQQRQARYGHDRGPRTASPNSPPHRTPEGSGFADAIGSLLVMAGLLEGTKLLSILFGTSDS